MVVKIGVLGGIGPEATGKFYRDLIEKIQKRGIIESNKDYPQIVINSIPAPELISERINEKDLDPYIRGLRELELLNVDYIVIICNTIHLYLDKLQNLIKTPIIDMRKLVKDRLSEGDIKSILLIGTPITMVGGLYDFSNIKIFQPDKREMAELSKIIFEFNKGSNKEEGIERVNELCSKYFQKGAEYVFVGCTEFSVMLDSQKFAKIDPLEILIDFIVKDLFNR